MQLYLSKKGARKKSAAMLGLDSKKPTFSLLQKVGLVSQEEG
jgi:hypothetical protein